MYVAHRSGKQFKYCMSLCIALQETLVFWNTDHYHCCIQSVDVTQLPVFLVKGRRQHGKCGRHIQRTQIHSSRDHASQMMFQKNLYNTERFMIVMYQKTCEYSSCDYSRRDLFPRSRSMSTIPPTSDTQLQHVKRAVLWAGHIWWQSLVARPSLPSPADWSWVHDPVRIAWRPLWWLVQRQQMVVENWFDVSARCAVQGIASASQKSSYALICVPEKVVVPTMETIEN